MSYIFGLTVKDNLWKETVIFMALFSGFILLLNLIVKRFEVKNNWDRIRCRPEIMQYAWLYGKGQNKNMEYCLENAGKQVKQSNIVDPTMQQIESGYKVIDDKLIGINSTLTALDTTIKNTDVAAKNKERALAIHKNVLALKEGVQKVIAGLIVQNNMNNGVLKTTNATRLLNEVLATSISQDGNNILGIKTV